MIMKNKNITNAFQHPLCGGLLALTFGCSTTKHTENMPVGGRLQNSAGEHSRAAGSTPFPSRRQNHDGSARRANYFVFPDPAKNVLYVGHEPEYQKYQKLRLENQLAQEELNTAQMNADWGPWGPWY